MPPTKHSRLGASKSKRWINCPGSVQASEGIEESVTWYATEGTAAHELLEWCLADGLQAEEFVGATVEVEEKDGVHEVEVTEEMAEAVQVAIDHVRGLLEPGDELLLEQEFDLEPLGPPEPMFGTSDVCVVKRSQKHLDVLDYKHGQGVAVDATENTQLLYYALGAVVKLHQSFVPETITIWIMQPRGHHPAGPFRSYSLTFQELVEFKKELFERAEATQDPEAPLNPGEWCRFCPALPTCPAQREHAIEVAQTEFDAVPVEELEEALPDPGQLTAAQLTLVIERGDILTDWVKSVNAHAVAMLERGEELPGFKLVEGRSNRRWKDEEAAERYLANKGLRKEERFRMKLVSPAQAEKALKRRGELGSAKKLPQLWEKPEGRPKLVPESDSRPALTPSVYEDFEALPESTD